MKIPIIALHLSLTASSGATNSDPQLNRLRSKMIRISRDIDGTAVAEGPEGATARMSMALVDEELSLELATTAAPEAAEGAYSEEILAVFQDAEEDAPTTVDAAASETIASAPEAMSLSPKAAKANRHDHGAEAVEDAHSVPMLLSKGSKSEMSAPAADHMSVSTPSPGDSKADKETGAAGKAQKTSKTAKDEALSMIADASTVEAAPKAEKAPPEGSVSIHAKAEKEPLFSMKAKAGKQAIAEHALSTETLSMHGKAEKELSMPQEAVSVGDRETVLSMHGKAEKELSIPEMVEVVYVRAGKATKDEAGSMVYQEAEKAFSLGGKAEKTAFSMDGAASVFSMNSKAEKAPAAFSMEGSSTVLSMDSNAAKRESKAGKVGSKAEKDALSMPAAKATKQDSDMSMGKADLVIDSKAEKASIRPMDSKAEKTNNADKQTLSMPAAEASNEEATDLSMGYGKAGKEDAHPRLFSTRKREPTRRRLSESLSYSMSAPMSTEAEVESATESTEAAVDYTDAPEADTTEESVETAEAADAEISDPTQEELAEMSTSLLAKASKTTAAHDPMGKAVKGDHVLSVAPKSAKSTSKASKAATVMSVDAKAEKLEMSVSLHPKSEKSKSGKADFSLVMSVGKAEKEKSNSLSMRNYKLFDNRRKHNHVRKQGAESR